MEEPNIGLRFNRRYFTQKNEKDSEYIRFKVLDLADAILNFCPKGREQSLAITKLEEVMFWSDAGIVRED